MRQNKAGIVAPISCSQNFLTSASVIHRLISRTSLNADDHVLEIGPGKGHLTRALLKRCGKVTAVELDAGLYDALRRRFMDQPNLRLYHQDILGFRLPSHGGYKVFSNIPFSITTDIVRKMITAPNPPMEMWLIMQRDAARRFMGQKKENLLSLSIKPNYDMEIQYHFRREDFHPSPSVDIVMVHFIRKPQPDISRDMRRNYERFIREGLKYGVSHLCTKKQISRVMRETGAPVISGETLYIQWLCLFRCWSSY